MALVTVALLPNPREVLLGVGCECCSAELGSRLDVGDVFAAVGGSFIGWDQRLVPVITLIHTPRAVPLPHHPTLCKVACETLDCTDYKIKIIN